MKLVSNNLLRCITNSDRGEREQNRAWRSVSLVPSNESEKRLFHGIADHKEARIKPLSAQICLSRYSTCADTGFPKQSPNAGTKRQVLLCSRLHWQWLQTQSHTRHKISRSYKPALAQLQRRVSLIFFRAWLGMFLSLALKSWDQKCSKRTIGGVVFGISLKEYYEQDTNSREYIQLIPRQPT